jgi:hypothetical protein
VATLVAVTVAELQLAIADIQAGLRSEPPPDQTATLRALRALHDVLMRATADAVDPPVTCLDAAASLAADLPDELTDSLGPRQRTVYRLLRAEKWTAAWQVLADNAVGVVEQVFDASTATGQPRSAERLPLLTRIEPPVVFAELPGFRDPRYDAPDACYDISESVRLKHQLDEIDVTGSVMTLGGWAAFDLLTTDAREVVRLVLSQGDDMVTVVGRRLRRADLVSGRGEALRRRAWAGWAAGIDVADPRLRPGSWALSIELEHDGLIARASLGPKTSELAAAAAAARLTVGSHVVTWDTDHRRWRLVIGEPGRS